YMSRDENMDFPILKERVLNAFPDFGDDMLRVSGIGEYAVALTGLGSGKKPENFEPALELVAQHGWAFQQHVLSPAEVNFVADTYAKVNEITPIASLHWSLAHVPAIDTATLNKMKEIGV